MMYGTGQELLSRAYHYSVHQLIIIGNGFDLECGLPSKFSNFMEARTNHISSLNEVLHHEGTYGQDDGETLGRQLYGGGATIWDAVLACRGNDLWRDIEGTIKWFLTESQNPWERKLSPTTLIDALESSDPNGIIMSALQGEQGVGFVALGFLEAYMGKQETADIDIDTMLTFLLDQLHSIESAFGKYLEDPPGWRIERTIHISRRSSMAWTFIQATRSSSSITTGGNKMMGSRAVQQLLSRTCSRKSPV